MIETLRSAFRRAARKPPRQLMQIAAREIWNRTGADELAFPLHDQDVWDSSRPITHPPRDAPLGPGARIGWVMVPPTPGSGGHTTLFRMIDAARRAGYRNTVLFYDKYNGDFAVNVQRLRKGWPWVECEVAEAGEDLSEFDALVASAWHTAHVVASRSAAASVRRLYFLQDYEPDFYARGSLHALAEDSYRFGFEHISLGSMIRGRLLSELGVGSEAIVYGTDRDAYRVRRKADERDGVVFFAKKANDRRGYRMGILALREFQKISPDTVIHVYGDRVDEHGVSVVNHGYLAPERLNELYNSVKAGLILSFTNVSLVPAELAAAGATPVMNDFAGAREVFDNPHAVWAQPTPYALARSLASAVGGATDDEVHALAAWPTPSWADTTREFLRVLGK